ncbi:glycoside hydrolase family 25 protein [Streptomyces sparsogenes]|uniref:glycoside hydrolase family 25 protein n=1 Tax=Streptomyces sparsogenes TaxID=67365 RepID=UPI0034002821
MSTCRGVDVSAYQAKQDWAAHKEDGVVFAFAKATEGQRSKDSRFDSHMAGITKAGLVPGAYHFGWPTQDPAREAANYIAAVKPYARRGFLHWLDLERYSDGRNYGRRNNAEIRAWVTRWLALVDEAFPGQRVGVYTSGSDLTAGHVPPGVPLWYPAYPWGPASYSKAESVGRPRPANREPEFWQFTSQPIDRSICYMSAAALRAWAAGTTPVPEEDDPMAGMSNKDIASAVWETDGVVGVPPEWTSKGNPEWKPASILIDLGKRVRSLDAKLTAQTATIKALADALAARDGSVDVDALVSRITQAIERVTVRLDVPEEG